MAEKNNLSAEIVEAKPVPYMPKISGAGGKIMAPEDLKLGDILVVYWKEPVNYKAEISIVHFREFEDAYKLKRKRVIYFSRAEFGLLDACCYPLEDISEMRFCARDSSASATIFLKLHEFYKENKRLTERLERIKNRLMDIAA